MSGSIVSGDARLRAPESSRPWRRRSQLWRWLRVKITTEKLPKSRLSLQIELDKERLEKGLDQAARRLSQKYPIHGFRPGKVPMSFVAQRYGSSVQYEVITDKLGEAFAKAHGFGGTPVIVRPSDGAVIEGYRAGPELKAFLSNTAAPTKG